MTTYDPKTTPLRPARVIVVSGPADRALSTAVAVFTSRQFRVATAPGVNPVTLELGNWWAPYLLWGSKWPGKFSGSAKHGIVHVRLDSRAEGTTAITLLVAKAWSAQLFSPIFLDAVNDAARIFAEAGVLVDAGAVVDARRVG